MKIIFQWLTDRHKKALYEALEKVKAGKLLCSQLLFIFPGNILVFCINGSFSLIVAELMILGFISLTLVFSQYYIAGICIPTSVADTLLPCPVAGKNDKMEEHHRRLLWYERRILAGAEPKCNDVSHKFVYGS